MGRELLGLVLLQPLRLPVYARAPPNGHGRDRTTHLQLPLTVSKGLAAPYAAHGTGPARLLWSTERICRLPFVMLDQLEGRPPLEAQGSHSTAQHRMRTARRGTAGCSAQHVKRASK